MTASLRVLPALKPGALLAGMLIFSLVPGFTPTTFILIGLGVLCLVVGSYLGLFVAPPERYMGEVQRIMYVHVPTAWNALLAITFAFIEAAAADPFAHANGRVALANPLSEKFVELRPSLLPGLIDAVSHNRRHGRRDVRLFCRAATLRILGRAVRDESARRDRRTGRQQVAEPSLIRAAVRDALQRRQQRDGGVAVAGEQQRFGLVQYRLIEP